MCIRKEWAATTVLCSPHLSSRSSPPSSLLLSSPLLSSSLLSSPPLSFPFLPFPPLLPLLSFPAFSRSPLWNHVYSTLTTPATLLSPLPLHRQDEIFDWMSPILKKNIIAPNFFKGIENGERS
jgi:hypothetical protein